MSSMDDFKNKLKSKFKTHVVTPAGKIQAALTEKVADTYRQAAAKYPNKVMSPSEFSSIKKTLTLPSGVADKLGKLIK